MKAYIAYGLLLSLFLFYADNRGWDLLAMKFAAKRGAHQEHPTHK